MELRLAAKDSPVTIARALAAKDSPVSHETIHQGIYAHGRRGLAAGVHTHPHRRRQHRKHHRGEGAQARRASPLGTSTLITARPEIAGGRSEVGHFEGDLNIDGAGRSAVVTWIDRASRFNFLGDLPDDHGAESVLACLVELFDRVPDGLRHTLSWDQGRELARWAALEELTGIDVYVAEPHSPRSTHRTRRSTTSRAAGCHLERPVGLRPGRPRLDQPADQRHAPALTRWESAHDGCHRYAVALTG